MSWVKLKIENRIEKLQTKGMQNKNLVNKLRRRLRKMEEKA